MSKKGHLLVVIAILVAMTGVFTVSAQDAVEVELGEITQRIIDRGELICGANQFLFGFGFANDAGEFEGFDVDICRAVAAAILGDANAVSFRPLSGAERQAAVQGGEIDMMSRNTTYTLSRDVVWGVVFGPTTFYDAQGIGVRTDLGISSAMELDGASICVQSGTTTELNIADFITSNGLDISIQTYPDGPSTWEAFVSGACEAWTTDKSGIGSYHGTSEDPGALMILPEDLSKEPLGPLSPSGDENFAEIIRWTVYGMINAEEEGITSENIDEFLDSDDPVIGRILGIGDNISGEYVGLENDFMVEVIRQVGNYGEVYDRNLAPLGLVREGSVNASYLDGGLIYAPPFR